MAFETFDTICITRGAGAAGTVTATLNGTARDITGWTGRLVLKKKKSDPDSEAAINKDLVIYDAPNGVFSWELTATETASLSVRTYQAEFHLVPDNGEPIKAQGLAESREEVYDG